MIEPVISPVHDGNFRIFKTRARKPKLEVNMKVSKCLGARTRSIWVP